MLQFVSWHALRALLVRVSAARFLDATANDVTTLFTSSGRPDVPRNSAVVPRVATTSRTALLVRVGYVALRFICRVDLLRLNEGVHDTSSGRPTSVTVGTTSSRQPDVDPALAGRHTHTLAHNGSRIVVVVATLRVHRSCKRRRTRFAIDLDFPTTPLVSPNHAQIVVIQHAHARGGRLFSEVHLH
jgi:hypothetical protein